MSSATLRRRKRGGAPAPPTVERVSMGGVVFGVIALAWLAYLLPWFLKNRDQGLGDDLSPSGDIADSMQVIRDSSACETELPDPNLELSTPMVRDAIRYRVARASHTAVRRRRISLVISLLILGASIALPFFTTLPWWVWLVGPAVLIGWVIVARWSVRVINKNLNSELYRLEHGWDEMTVAVKADDRVVPTTGKDNELSIEISLPLHVEPNLMAPVPIPPPTYTNRALTRSVRQVDLNPILPSSDARFPVSDSFPQEALPLSGFGGTDATAAARAAVAKAVAKAAAAGVPPEGAPAAGASDADDTAEITGRLAANG